VDLQGTEWLEEQEAEKSNYLGQSTENHLLYGTNGPATDTVGGETPTATPEKYTGFAPRLLTPDDASGNYSPMNPDPATAAQKGVFDAEGTGSDTTSIFFVRWGKNACSLITPKDDPQYGLRIEDMGLQMEHVVDSSSHEPSKYRRVYMKEYEWKHGLSIYPGSYGGNHVARLRNIETALSFNNSGLISICYQIIREFFLDDTMGVMMYMPPRLRTIWDILMEAKLQVPFSAENPYEMSPDAWAGKVFIRTCRAISIREAAVAAV
jgi:hypothetical protein